LRIFAISDIHVDYDENRYWLQKLSRQDYQNDILILAGDVSDRFGLLMPTFDLLKRLFKEVMYIPGNHELWVNRDHVPDSIVKFKGVNQMAIDCGMRTAPYHLETLSIVPLFGWYDGSFGPLSDELRKSWSDFSTCRWPLGYNNLRITRYFTDMNESALAIRNDYVISFSHFVPRIDLMPSYIPPAKRWIYPVLGCSSLGQQIRRLKSNIHVYGHSHVNHRQRLDNTYYINNAFGYPNETRIAAKKLACIFESP
jgi:predicted phosphodiesterase